MQATEESFLEHPTLMKYKVKPGTIDSGKRYEFKMAAMLCLKSLLTEHDMWIASNAPEVGSFDDVILRLGNVTYLLQLKHKDNPKPLTKAELGASKGDFALVKYLNDIKELKESLNCKNEQSFKCHLGPFDNLYFVIFTNRAVNDCDFLEQSKESVLDILNTNSNSAVHKVNVTKLPGSSYAEEINNYNNVYILNNQISVKTIDDRIREEMEKEVARHFKLSVPTNIKEIADKFTEYVADWAEGKFGVHYLLTKADILQKVSELFLKKYEIHFIENQFKFFNCTEKLAWNRILKDKKIILVEDDDNILDFLQEYIGDEVQKYCASYSDSLWSAVLSNEDRNALYKGHPYLQLYIRKIVKNSNIINYFDIYKSLWTAAKIPLLVEVPSADHYKNILNILEMSKYYHKIILVNKAGQCLPIEEDFKQLRFFASLNDVNEQERNVILTSNVSLQGRFPVVLQDVIDNSMLKFIKCKDIIQILCGNFNIGNNPTRLVDYFVERKISRIFIKSEVLDEIKDEDFIIEGEREEKLQINFVSKPNVRRLRDFDMAPIIERKLRGTGKYTDEKEHEPPTSTIHKPVHHFIVFDKKYFEWKASYGSLKNIKRYVVELENAEGNDILKTLTSKKTLLCGIPGIGKSILTDYIAHNAPTDKWIIKIELNAHTKYFKEQKKKTTNISDHLTYFNGALNHQLKYNFELTNGIFNRFRSSNNIIVVLDGFDEVSVLYEKIVSSIAWSFYDEGCHVLITTRDHMQSHLENEFNCFPVILKSLTKGDQIKLLSNYFSSEIKNPTSSVLIAEFIKILLKAAKCNLSDHDLDFTGIPLLSKLLADVFLDDCNNFVRYGDINNFDFDILYLYRTFIDKKIDIACKKFGDLSTRTTFSEYKKHHLLHALNLLFPNFKNIVEKLQKPPSFEGTHLHRLQEVGIITIDKYSNINFIHRTFSEYIVAKWLAKSVKSSDQKVRKISQILVKTRFSSHHRFMFNMFDRIVSKDCSLHTDIINGRIKEVSEKIKSDFNLILSTDKCERSILPLILLYHNTEAYNNPQFTFDNFGFKHITTNVKLQQLIRSIPTDILSSIKRDLLDYTVLDYAIQTLDLNVANELIVKTKISYINVIVPFHFKKLCLVPCVRHNYKNLFNTLLTYFAYNDVVYNNVQMNTTIKTYCNLFGDQSRPISEYYIRNFQQQTISQLLESNMNNIFLWYNNRYSNLHYVARFGTENQILELLQQGSKINKCDNRNNTPLHYAVLRPNKKSLDIFLERTTKLTKKNFDHETPLHLAIKHGSNDIIDTLISCRAGIDEQNGYGNTPLHEALNTEKYDIADVLISKGASISITDNDGDSALHIASYFGHNDIVNEILKMKVKIDAQNEIGSTALHMAISKNHLDVVKLLISKGASINITGNDGNSALHIASYYGHNDIVNEILKMEVNIDAQNKNGSTALYRAIEKNHLEGVKLLISKRASINITNNYGNNALHIASHYGHNDIVNEILKMKVNIDAQNKNGSTALYRAIEKNHLEIVKLLISKRASINITNNYGNNALHIASYYGHNDIVNEILKMKVNIDAQNKNGSTALYRAIEKNHLEGVKLLISKRASINITNNYGNNALHIASHYGHNDIVNEILKIKFNIDAQNKNGSTALYRAIEKNHLEIVNLLISKRASINITNNYGNNALHIASYYGHNDIVNEILKIKVNIDAQNKNGSTALYRAIEKNHLEIVKLLTSNGASINITDNDGDTALHIASYCGHNLIVNEILKMEVVIDALNKNGCTALYMAIEKNHLDVVKLLISKGASISITDNIGNNALQKAFLVGNNDIINEILKLAVRTFTLTANTNSN